MQMMIIGKTGSGKTYRAKEIIKSMRKRPIIFIDPTYNFINGINSLEDLDWTQSLCWVFYCPHEKENPEFDILTNYLFDLYFKYDYSGARPLLIIDEAHLYAKTHSNSMDKIATQSRRFFDVIYITQRPNLLCTRTGYTPFTQSDTFIIFNISNKDVQTVNKYADFEITEKDREFLSNKYYYIMSKYGEKQYFKKDGKRIKSNSNANNISHERV